MAHSGKQNILIFLFIAYALMLKSQHYNFRTYSVDEGLAQSQILSIIQDSRGYLWLGTYGGGISKFDGIKFQNFSKKDGLSDNIVSAVYEDKNGNIWMGMGNNEGGVCKYNGSSFETITTKNGLSNDKVYSIVQDNEGNMWFGTEYGLNKYDGKNITNYTTTKDGIIHNRIRAAIKDKNGNLWFGTDAGVLKYDGKKFSNISLLSKGEPAIIWSIKEDSKGNLWFAVFMGGVVRYDTSGKMDFYNEKNGLVSNVVYSICEDASGNMWFGTDSKGASMFDGNKFTNFSILQGLPNNRIREILKDRENNLWFATDGGLCKYSGIAFSSYSKSDGLPNDIVNSIFIDSKSNTWFGTEEGLCKITTDKIIKTYTVQEGLPHNRIWNINEDKDGNIWLGTYGGISIFDGNKFYNYNSKSGLHNDIIYNVFRDRENNIWIGTDAGIYFFDANKKFNKAVNILTDLKFYFTELVPNTHRIRSIYQDKSGNLWFGTREGGILKYNGKSFVNYTIKDGLGNNTVLSIIQDNQDNMWFATYGGGISKLITDKNNRISFESIDSKLRLSDDDASSLLMDSYGKMWVGTIKGLSKFDVEKYNKSGEIEIRNFGKEKGFTGVECSQNAGFIDKDGNLWEGTVKGVFKVNPSLTYLDTITPITHITKINLFFKDIDWKRYTKKDSANQFCLPKDITFPYNENHLTFSYVGLSFSAPEKVMYQFKLEGLDKDWSPPTSETYATYSKIPSGEYTFMVKSCNGDGFWNSEPTTYKFRIETPFWEKLWFIVFCGILFLFFIFLYIKWRERALKEEKKILEEKVELRTQELRSEKEKVDAAHKDIKDSINYAQRIQQSILPSLDLVKSMFDDYFIFYQPKDIVSGDFYWASFKNGKKIIAAVDCTGHGVPGAFMSMLGNTLLNEIVNEKGITSSDEILNRLRDGVIKNFQQSFGNSETKDGMDISLCVLDGQRVEFSGANNPLYLIKGNKDANEVIEIKGDKYPIGFHTEIKKFTKTVIDLEKGDKIYLFTDGYADQFGGPQNKKFKTYRMQKLLLVIKDKSMEGQKKQIIQAIRDWQGDYIQIDDMLIIGIQL